jgi:hypothetical protein
VPLGGLVLATHLAPSSKKGHRVFSPTLTGLGERSHLLSKGINLDTHIADIVNVMKWEDLENVCLVAHSYGGVPASCQAAASRDWLAEREAELLPVAYFHLVYTLPAPIADIAYQNKQVIPGPCSPVNGKQVGGRPHLCVTPSGAMFFSASVRSPQGTKATPIAP